MIMTLGEVSPGPGDTVVSSNAVPVASELQLRRENSDEDAATSGSRPAGDRQADPGLFLVDHPSLVDAYGEEFISKLGVSSALPKFLSQVDESLKPIYGEEKNLALVKTELNKILEALQAHLNDEGRFTGSGLLNDLIRARDLRQSDLSDKPKSAPETGFRESPSMFAIAPFSRLFQYIKSMADRTGFFRKVPEDAQLTDLANQIKSTLNTLAEDFAESVSPSTPSADQPSS